MYDQMVWLGRSYKIKHNTTLVFNYYEFGYRCGKSHKAIVIISSFYNVDGIRIIR